MSRITNTNPPKRGEKLTSSEINEVFIEVNNAFPLDSDNVRNEGIDQPSFDLNTSHGKSGIILIDADNHDDTSSHIVHANTAVNIPYDSPTTVNTFNLVRTFNEGQLLRVYWQFENEVVGSNTTPITLTTNATAWVVWLEWKLSSSGSFEPIPNQSDFEDIQISPATHGAATYNTYGCTFVNHAFVYRNPGSPSPNVIFPPARTGYGCWWYQADQNYTIYGLRLQCRGLVQNFYNSTPVNGPNTNAWELVDSPVSTHQITIDHSNLAFLLMEQK
tara:strand:+ start:12366 stop:13187 length:822 start_codon:yes stop_codon:yes gene_type:complete